MRIQPHGRSLAPLVVLLFSHALTPAARAQGPTVLDRVYTAAQAARGAGQYEMRCAACHEGDEADAPPLKGAVFIDRWRESPLDDLFGFMKTNMPGNAPGSLMPSAYLEIFAYILQANGYASGTSDLAPDKLGNILLVGPGGPQPLPDNAFVRVVGCLAPANGDDWSLTAASLPVRARVIDETNPDELAKSAAAPPGTAVYRLRNASDLHADALKGQRVQAKGVFTRSGSTSTVSVQSLERAGGAACGK